MLVSVAYDDKILGYSDEEAVTALVNRVIDSYLKNGKYNTLSDLIKPGAKVIIKPNLVMDKNSNIDVKDNPLDCFITNWTVIFALLDRLNEVPNLKIVIAECPMQWCNIDKIVTEPIKSRLSTAYKYSPVDFMDLRAFKYERGANDKLKSVEKAGEFSHTDITINEYSEFTTVDSKSKRLRIMDYPLEGLRKYHSAGKHIYQFDNTYIDCDYIINVPKLKTHMKAGMTGAMKNFVGAISDKECIPHHTKGSKLTGGDCYEKFALDKAIGEELYDLSYGFINTKPKWYEFIRRITNRGILRMRRKLSLNDNISGSWYGNYTLPRAIIDINRAIMYGGRDGKLHEEPQRKIFTLMDCIVMGEGNGPLAPKPNNMGTIIFSDSCVAADMVAATLIGFDYRKIHYLSLIDLNEKYNLFDKDDCTLYFNNREISGFEEMKQYRIIEALPAKYWKGHIEDEKD